MGGSDIVDVRSACRPERGAGAAAAAALLAAPSVFVAVAKGVPNRAVFGVEKELAGWKLMFSWFAGKTPDFAGSLVKGISPLAKAP